MAEGSILIPVEQAADIRALLPRGVSVKSSSPFGSAVKVVISGNQVDEGATYQFVIVDEPLRRVVELVKDDQPTVAADA